MNWKNYKIGDFLTRSKEPVKIKQQEEYTLVTIRMYHKGVAKRSQVNGSSIKSPTLYKVRAGQFILSGIDARNRAFGIVPEELEGAIVTNDFWTHDIDTSIIDINFFYWFTTTPQFYEACIKASEGTTNRQRLQADKFYSFDVLLPSIAEQQEWVERISYMQNKHEQLDKELAQQHTYLQLLRQNILQEAGQGQLTKQDPADEPATELLKRIKAEKDKLLKTGKLKKERELPIISDNEHPCDTPCAWTFARLGNILRVINGRAYKMHEMLQNGTPLLRVGNLFTSNEWYYSDLKLEPDKYIDNGDLIYAWSASFGPFIWNGGKAIYHYHIWKLEFFDITSYDKDFMYLYLQSITQKIKASGNGIAMIHMTKERMEQLPVPIPPLAEQQRIVAKVQQLQQQLSQLETQVQQSRQYAQQLLQSVLREAFEVKGKVKMYEENEMITMAAEE